MRIKHLSLILSSIVLAALLPAQAQEERKGPFVGLSWGQTTMETDQNNIDPSDCGGGIPCNIRETEDMWKIYAGHRFNNWFAIETGFRTFGEAQNTLPDGTFTIDARSWDNYLRGQVALGPIDLFGKLGFSWVDGEYAQVCTTGCVSGRVRFNGATWAGGLGIMGNIGKVGLRLEWEPFQVDRFSRWDVVSVGIQYRFGG